MSSQRNLPIYTPSELSRRRFLALAAASAALASAVGCDRSPQQHGLVPYTKKPEEIVPGVATYYASAAQEGEHAYGVLVKTREGRPIHIEGNPEDPIHVGKASPRVAADLLGLYDPDRLRRPLRDGVAADLEECLNALVGALRVHAKEGRETLLVTPAAISPSRRALIAELSASLPGLRHLEWEPHHDHVGSEVTRRLYGQTMSARPRFDRADAIVSLGADFLGTAGDVTDAAIGYRTARKRVADGGRATRLYVLEGTLSLTGSNADRRVMVRPSALGLVGLGIARALVARGRSLPSGLAAGMLEPFEPERVAAASGVDAQVLHQLADDLHHAGDRALLVAGAAGGELVHEATHLVNTMLGAVGTTVDLVPARHLADPAALGAALQRMEAGRVGAVLLWGVNPAYDFPDRVAFARALAKVSLAVKFGTLPDETSARCSLVLPVSHWLESWGDFDVPDGSARLLAQPAIAPLYDTLQGEDILLKLLGRLGRSVPPSYHEYIRRRWRTVEWPEQSPVAFERFWEVCLHDGVFLPEPRETKAPTLNTKGFKIHAGEPSSGLELVLNPDSRVFDGRHANNGWLQELPDAVTKVTWGNPLSISTADATRLGLEDGDAVNLTTGGVTVTATVLIQRAQAAGVLGLPLGHGREVGSVARRVGVNAWPITGTGGRAGFLKVVDSLERTGRSEPLARTQDHFDLGGRDIARLFTLDEFAQQAHGKNHHPPLASLYPEAPDTGVQWGMAIDLNACIGCGACVLACQSENNVAVVGPEQVRRGRSMHWIRIDRYDMGEEGGAVHEPMLCQQCGNAPCETVCPVQATNHSPDGLNQMVYNRCVGTRYCGNNCPYKVRRFNYLEFSGDVRSPLELARNPEVTVRPRGVMEKCTFCVQRIRNAEQVAKDQRRPLADGDVKPACAVACPTQAIVFGNLRDRSSEVANRSTSPRSFRVLEELGVKPSVSYLAALRNPPSRGDQG